MPVNPRGKDTDEALRQWIADEFKEAPKRIFDLGKFLFGVSSGSIGVLVAISKYFNNTWTFAEWGSLVAFVLSGAISLFIAAPRVHRLHANFDLAKAHESLVMAARDRMIAWGVTWTLAVALAGYGLRS